MAAQETGMKQDSKDERNNNMDRRRFIAKTVLAGAGMAALSGNSNAQPTRQGKNPSGANKRGFRKLGTLEV